MVFDIDRDDDFLKPCLPVSWFNEPRHFQMSIHYATKIKPHEFIIYLSEPQGVILSCFIPIKRQKED